MRGKLELTGAYLRTLAAACSRSAAQSSTNRDFSAQAWHSYSASAAWSSQAASRIPVIPAFTISWSRGLSIAAHSWYPSLALEASDRHRQTQGGQIVAQPSTWHQTYLIQQQPPSVIVGARAVRTRAPRRQHREGLRVPQDSEDLHIQVDLTQAAGMKGVKLNGNPSQPLGHLQQQLLQAEVSQRTQMWEVRRKKLQALPDFPKAELDDPRHERTRFAGPPRRFLPGGIAWESPQEAGSASAVPAAQQKLLQVAVVGVPNAGKSSMVNALAGSKVAAVSSKTNTTTMSALGAFTEGAVQVALFDTPGVVASGHARDSGHRTRVRSAWGVASMCDLLLLIVDAHRQIRQPDPRVLRLVRELSEGPLPNWDPPPCILVFNKVDKLAGGEHTFASVATLADSLRTLHTFQDVYPVSVLQGTGMQHLRQDLIDRARPGEWVLPAGSSADVSPVNLCREIVREKLYERMRQEVPYVVQFEHKTCRLASDGAVLVKMNVVVPDRRVQKIIKGRRGAAIGEIGIRARRELEDVFRNRVHLFLDVVAKNK